MQTQIPTDRQLYILAFEAIHALGGSAQFSELSEWIEARLDLSDVQLSQLRNSANSQNDTKIKHNTRFALTHLRIAGYLDNPSLGLWKLTAEGRTTQHLDPGEVIRRKQTNPEAKQGISWRKRRRKSPSDARPLEVKPLTDTVSDSEVVVRKHESDTPNVSHDEIQWLLLSLGSDMGLNVWVASNDRNRSFQGKAFSEIPRLRNSLPVQFSQQTQKIIELIDVLWLDENSIIAAFEIEHTTSIYSGLLRMSDLMTLQPNITINLFIVAPDARREKVRSEINRPTFADSRLPQACRYIAYSKLIERIETAKATGFLRYLNLSFLDEISEKMTIE